MVRAVDIEKKKKIKLDHRLERYEDFYSRAFTTVDIDEILAQGGGASLESFKDKSRGKASKDFHDVMFNRKKVKKADALGKEIWARFFRNENITRNKVGRVIVRKGHSFEFRDKIFKGGQFVPRAFLARRTNR